MKIPKIPTNVLKGVLALNVTFLLLMGFTYPYIEPGTASYVIAVLTLIPISLMLVMMTVLLYINKRRAKETTI